MRKVMKMRKIRRRTNAAFGVMAAGMLLALTVSAVSDAASAEAPGPRLTVDDPTVVEGDAGYIDLVFTVTLSNATGKTVTVDFATTDGTATAPSDYQPTSGQLTFNKRDTEKHVRVPVFGDTVYEGDETLELRISNAARATISDSRGTGTIAENDPPMQSLSVTRGGTGEGTVTSDPAGIDCGSDCDEDFHSGTSVALTATPAPGSTFTGWYGDCTGTGTCQVTMDSARSVGAIFDQPTADLGVGLVDSVDPASTAQLVDYTVTVENAGPDTAQSTSVTIDIPTGWAYVSTVGADGCTIASTSPAQIVCTLGSVAAGGSVSRTIQIRWGTTGEHTVSATASTSTHDPDAANDTTTETTTVNLL